MILKCWQENSKQSPFHSPWWVPDLDYKPWIMRGDPARHWDKCSHPLWLNPPVSIKSSSIWYDKSVPAQTWNPALTSQLGSKRGEQGLAVSAASQGTILHVLLGALWIWCDQIISRWSADIWKECNLWLASLRIMKWLEQEMQSLSASCKTMQPFFVLKLHDGEFLFCALCRWRSVVVLCPGDKLQWWTRDFLLERNKLAIATVDQDAVESFLLK